MVRISLWVNLVFMGNHTMSKLFQPLKIGAVELNHRIMLAPLTRYRCDDEWVPLPMVKEYYEQRASVPGTFLITEGTLISHNAAGRRNVPGIWSPAQVAAWKTVVDAVHAKGCYIYCQLWHPGRSGLAQVHRELGTRLLSASTVPLKTAPTTSNPNPVTPGIPEVMTEDDIQQVISEYVTAARNAIEGAGFDGVEIHGANGYLIDQFLQDTCNNERTDRWGGNIENRARFAIEVTKAVVAAVGTDRTAMRLSPFSEYNDMLMAEPLPQFTYLVDQLRGIGLSYLHLIEARVSNNVTRDKVDEAHTVAPLVERWGNASPVLLAGGFTGELARQTVDETYRDYDVGVVFGRHFISNPDLVFRIRESVGLAGYDRSVFYTPLRSEGYVDYPFSEQYLATQKAATA